MRPAVSSAASLETPREGDDSDLVWLELDDLEGERRGLRDLPADVAKMIRATADHLETLDPHALIGVEQNAPWSEVETAYRTRLAMFHPNRWSGYDLGELRPSMERVAKRISFAFAFLAEEVASNDARLSDQGGDLIDRPTRPVELSGGDCDWSGERPTFPSCLVPTISKIADEPTRARPPRPPPRKTA
jgi:hypothetical protein